MEVLPTMAKPFTITEGLSEPTEGPIMGARPVSPTVAQVAATAVRDDIPYEEAEARMSVPDHGAVGVAPPVVAEYKPFRLNP